MRFFKQILLVLMLAASATAQADIQAGRDYGVLGQPRPTNSGAKIEVLEFFFYGCPHCFHLHPALSAWEKKMPKDVELTYVPTSFNPSWEAMAYTFYALGVLGEQKRLHDPLFRAWEAHKMLVSREAATDFVVQNGVDRTKFSEAYNSFSVDGSVKHANKLVIDYGIRGTPTVIVEGKYVITELSPEDTIRVLNELLVKVRKERTGKK